MNPNCIFSSTNFINFFRQSADVRGDEKVNIDEKIQLTILDERDLRDIRYDVASHFFDDFCRLFFRLACIVLHLQVLLQFSKLQRKLVRLCSLVRKSSSHFPSLFINILHLQSSTTDMLEPFLEQNKTEIDKNVWNSNKIDS